jgi:general nucleoside transport system ATP-binding protein
MEENNKKVNISFMNITKRFGSNIANNNISFDIYDGEIVALLGENGSGKTTLMNMLSGIYRQDEGQILVHGEVANILSPRDAFNYGIGMVYQHFKLIETFTALENIVLGVKDKERSKIKNARIIVQEILNKYGFVLDLEEKVYNMSVSEKQTLEIIKVLYRGAQVLVLDEPTAVLTPLEITKLFKILRNMKNDGKSIIIITHKLNEVMEISDRVVVLRKGEYIGSLLTKDTNESQLTEMMVGKKIELNINRTEPVNPVNRLLVTNLSYKNEEGRLLLDDVSFVAKGGEILGIAGISGSGQKEVLEAIAGLLKLESGDISYFDPDKNDEKINLRNKTPRQIREMGVRLSFVPEDRLGMGLVGNMSIIDNMLLRSFRKGHNWFVNRHNPQELAIKTIHDLDVKTENEYVQIRKLSGGNVQKLLVGREIASSPKVLMCAYPVRGLDINSSYLIYNLLDEQKRKGASVIYVGEDLDVLLALCDKILVLCEGKVNGLVNARTSTKERIGYLMTNLQKEEN